MKVFVDVLIGEVMVDEKVVVVYVVMGGGTGLNYFEKYFVDRMYDVGIVE